MATKVDTIAGKFYYLSMFFLFATVGFGAAFIVLSMSSRFFEWEISDCKAEGLNVNGSLILEYNLDMTADIGWNRFTVTHLNQGADSQGGCFGDFVEGDTYPIEDYQVHFFF